MLKPQGYGIVVDPGANVPIEHDTITCSHCNKIVIVPPGWKPETMPNKCKGCGGYLCLGCWGARTLGAPCVTWKQQIDQMLARNEALKSYGIAFAILFCILFFTGRAFGAGGACPSGANYVSPTNPTGPKVTLSTLGITSCYYVAANGSDSNNGTSELSPFLHAPGMNNCATNCSISQLASGNGIILRGGDTWHFGDSSATPYAGVWAGTCIGTQQTGLCLHDLLPSGTIYFGVDQSWFTGASWSRPIFTVDNSLCNSGTIGTMPDGFICSNGTDVTGTGQATYVVSGCAYQVSTANDLVDMGFSKNLYLDNFELTGLCQKDGGQPNGNDTYIDWGANQGPSTITNLYVHGDSHIQFVAANGGSGCPPTVPAAVCQNLYVLDGNVTVGTVGNSYFFNVFDFSDSDPGGTGLSQPGTDHYNFAYNVIRYQSQAVPGNVHVMHDNLFEFYYENGHSNLWEDSETSPIGVIYDNVFRHLFPAGSSVIFWPGPTGSSDASYFFDNVVYDAGPAQYFDWGNTGRGMNNGQYFVFNNTFQENGSAQIISACPVSTNNVFNNTSNHFIDNVTAFPSPCGNLTNTTPLTLTNAVATTDGYTASQTFGYSPTASNSPTVGVGTNEFSGYCSTLLASADSLIQAAGTACRSDTTYAVSYNATNHTVSSPARTVVARPLSAAWDVGAYQFSSSSVQTGQDDGPIITF